MKLDFVCGRDTPLTLEEFIEFNKMLDEAQAKWEKLRAKHPGKTTREIIELEDAVE